MMRALRQLSRTAPGPLAVRGVVFLAAATGLWLAAPSTMVSVRLLLPIVAMAALPALAPGGRVVGVAMAVTVGLWLTSTLGFGEEASVWRTFVTACALYVTHCAAALAAVLPYDAVVDHQVIIGWAGRAVTVLFASGLVTGVVVVVAPTLTPTTSTLALLGGLAVVFALIALLSKAADLRRR